MSSERHRGSKTQDLKDQLAESRLLQPSVPLLEFAESDRQAAGSPVAGCAGETSGARGAAGAALAALRQAPIVQYVPVAADETLATPVAIGAAAFVSCTLPV